MKTELQLIAIRDISNGYSDNQDEGVIGFGGKLNIRPAYQRNFVYKDKQRDAVMDTINHGWPLNMMYWSKNEDGTFELLDGQQRTISFCQYVNGEYSIGGMYFHNLTEDKRNAILDYKCMVQICEGSDSERLDWFRRINIAGEKLTEQELLNANYTGSWLADAKIRFSKKNCVAENLGKNYVNGQVIRQDFLQTALDWISDGKIAEYMAQHQHDKNSNELWQYFQNVINWIDCIFDTKNYYRKEMKGLNWGKLYNQYHNNPYDASDIEKRVNELMSDEEVTNKKGVYEYILSDEDDNLLCKLSLRTFSDSDKRTVYEKQGHKCKITGQVLPIEQMEADHIIPWRLGGKTTIENCQMIAKTINKAKSDKLI